MNSISMAMLAAATLVAPPAVAQQASQESMPPMAHDAASQPAAFVSLAEWSKRVEAEIDKTLVYPHETLGNEVGVGSNGIVRVKFNCTSAGGTQNVEIRKTSGSAAYDREALRVVRKLVQMHPLPTGMKNEQPYEAIIVFAKSSGPGYDRAMQSTRDEITQRTNWFKQDAPRAADPM
jgi:protein TonB